MAQIKIQTTFTITDPQGNVQTFQVSKTISGLTAIEVRDYDLTANATRNLWDPTQVTTEGVSDFDFMAIITDGNVDFEGTVNEGDANEELLSWRVVDSLPFMLGADDAYYNHSASDIFAGTLDVIDKLRADEPGGSARKVKVILAT